MTRELQAIRPIVDALDESMPNASHLSRMALTTRYTFAAIIVSKLSAAGVFRQPRRHRERL